MQTINQIDPLRDAVAVLKRDGALALVPTMGALHDGHMTLVREAKKRAAHVAVSIFVNPRQFGPSEDLDAYPRQLERDSRLLEAEGVSLLWAPTVDAMYPSGYATNISVAGVSEGLCGASRAGHFDGVATVVSKLFGMTQAGRAFFGEKDWQQLQVVKRLVADLNIPIRIIGCPTIREADGLAMSSRNVRLSPEGRARAPILHQAMQTAAEAIRSGTAVDTALSAARATLAEAGFGEVEYLDLRSAEGLLPMATLDRPARLLAAVWLGDVRMIDNIAV